MASKPKIFQTPEVAELLRASRFTLNRLMLRCEIETSYGRRGIRGSRLLFTIGDVGTLAIAYWLFRSGLRTPAIKDALAHKHLEGLRRKLVGLDEIEDEANEAQFLVTWRIATGPKTARQEVRQTDTAGVQRILESERQYGFVVIPVGRLLRELAERIRGTQRRRE